MKKKCPSRINKGKQAPLASEDLITQYIIQGCCLLCLHQENASKTNNHQCLPTKLEQCLLVWIPSTSHSVPPLTPHTHIFVGPSCSFGTVSKSCWVTDVHYYLSSSSSAASLDVNHPILAWTLKLPLTTESAKRSHYWNVDTYSATMLLQVKRGGCQSFKL